MASIDTSGRNASMGALALRGLATVVVALVLGALLWMRYDGKFDDAVRVTITMSAVGDGLDDGADVRYDGLVVGEVKSVSGDAGDEYEVKVNVKPNLASGIPSAVTARTVPSNIFGVNAVELVPPAATAAGQALADGAQIKQDTSVESLALQDALDDLRELFAAVPPARVGEVFGTIADLLRGSGKVVNLTIGLMAETWKTFNGLFPEGAPPGFDDFNKTVNGINRSAPELIRTLGNAIEPSITILQNQRNLTAMLTASGVLADRTQSFFAANGDAGKQVPKDLAIVTGALGQDPQGLAKVTSRVNTLLNKMMQAASGHNGKIQLNLGIAFANATRNQVPANCPVYDGGKYGVARGPECGGTGNSARPASSQPGSVTTGEDGQTLTTALDRTPSATDQLMLGPFVTGAQAEGSGR